MQDDKLIKKYKGYLDISHDIRTKFLNIHQKEVLKYIIGNSKKIYFFGGFLNSEYEVAYITSTDYLGKENLINFDISVYEIIYNQRYLEISNRNVLGTLMSLGIKREVLGDIYVNDKRCFFVVLKEIENYVINNFNQINSVKIELKKVTNQIIEKKENINLKSINVSSLRLDLIIAHSYNLSREKAKEIIESDLVKVNQKNLNNSSYNLKESDIISVRGKGRIIVNKILGETKKGKIRIEIGLLQ